MTTENTVNNVERGLRRRLERQKKDKGGSRPRRTERRPEKISQVTQFQPRQDMRSWPNMRKQAAQLGLQWGLVMMSPSPRMGAKKKVGEK